MTQYFDLYKAADDWFIRRKSDDMLFWWGSNEDNARMLHGELEYYAYIERQLEELQSRINQLHTDVQNGRRGLTL